MKCEKCNQEFKPSANAELSAFDKDCAQILTSCTNCGTAYYTFTSGDWTLDEQAQALINNQRSRRR